MTGFRTMAGHLPVPAIAALLAVSLAGCALAPAADDQRSDMRAAPTESYTPPASGGNVVPLPSEVLRPTLEASPLGEPETAGTEAPPDATEPAQPEVEGTPPGSEATDEPVQGQPISPADAASQAPFPTDTYLFIEILEEREMKSETGRQTTSFAGDQESYSFDAAAEKLEGTLKGGLAGDRATIVGRVVVTRIDRTSATVGQLYAFTEAGQAFGPVVVERVLDDGIVVVRLGDKTYSLAQGHTVALQLNARGGDGGPLAVGTSQHEVTVTNHGLLPTAGLTVTAY